jgi:hypothetical protein
MPILPPNSRPPNEQWLIYDNRDALKAADKPGMHAFITGISEYPNLPKPGEPLTASGLGMRRLSSTALTAYLIFDWLLSADSSNSLSVPLATCRLLLSPNENELNRAGALRTAPPMRDMNVPRCEKTNFSTAVRAWRADAIKRRDDATFFYFAGHGIQTAGIQALILEGFGGEQEPLGTHLVDTLSLRAGMAPFANLRGDPPPTFPRPDIARTQFYFVDACRNRPSRMPTLQQLRVNSVFDVEEPDIADDRRAPIFYAALPEGVAQAAPEQQTLFSLALLQCFSGDAARPPDETDPGKSKYYISSQSLNEGLKRPLDAVNKERGGRQTWMTDGVGEDVVLCYLPAPPSVPISIVVDPETALGQTSVKVKDLNTAMEVCCFKQPPDAHPFTRSLPAGPYQLSPVNDAAAAPREMTIFVEPLRQRHWRVKV